MFAQNDKLKKIFLFRQKKDEIFSILLRIFVYGHLSSLFNTLMLYTTHILIHSTDCMCINFCACTWRQEISLKCMKIHQSIRHLAVIKLDFIILKFFFCCRKIIYKNAKCTVKKQLVIMWLKWNVLWVAFIFCLLHFICWCQ